MTIKYISMGLVASALAFTGPAAAQPSGYSEWERFTIRDGVEILYAVKRERDHFRVMWQCNNLTSQFVNCSVGAGERKLYNCYRGTSRIGETFQMGERSGVRPNSAYTFGSEMACQGTGATSVRPFAQISIED